MKRNGRRKFWKKFKQNVIGKIHQSWFVVAACVGIVIGIILGLTLRISFFDSAIWIIVAALVLLVCYLQPRGFLIILAVAAGIIMALYRCSLELAGEDYIEQLYGKTVTVAGTIDGDPETEDGKTKFKLRDLKFGNDLVEVSKTTENAIDTEKIENVSNEIKTHTMTGNLYISASQNEDLARGDQITLKGKLTEGFGTYAGFMSRPEIVNWARPSPGDPAVEARNWFAERVKSQVAEPEVNLGLSYLLGMKTGLDENLETNLRTIGLTHVVVASGAHLSIMVGVARKIFGKLSRFLGVGVALIFVIFFMAVVGWTPSIMRAGMMSILGLLMWTVGRKFMAWRIILLVMAATLMMDPMYLMNLGWQLSFASYAGIMILGPMLTRFFYGKRKPKFVASTVLTTLAATLLTLPITLYNFGAVSLISVLPNMIILPTLPYVMGLVFLSGVVVGVPGVETVAGFVATKALDLHIGTMEFFGKMKSFLVEIETEQVWVFGLYAVIGAVVVIGWLWQKRKKRRKKAKNVIKSRKK